MLNKRVVEHNLRTIASYYRRIRAARLGDMLGLDPSTLEEHLSEMSSDADIYVKVRAARSKLAPSLNLHCFFLLSRCYALVLSFLQKKKLSRRRLTNKPFLSPFPSSQIDRPAGIVSFDKPRAPEAVLTDWASDMGKLLGIMESTCHLINRENMVHKV